MGSTFKLAYSLAGPLARPATGRPSYEGGGGGRGPIAFDFSDASLPAGATLERASTGTRYDASGLLVVESSDVARFDYDPGTLALLGLLVEPQRTNKALATQDMTAPTIWAPSNATITGNAVAAPDGTTTADKIVPDTNATNSHSNRLWWQSNYGFTPTIGADYCLSAYFKAAEYTWVNLAPDIYVWGGSGTAHSYLNLSTGALGAQGTLIDDTWVEDLPSGWWRLATLGQAQANAIFASVVAAVVAEADNDSYFAGNGSDGLYAWGWQLEEAPWPSSYIPNSSTSTTATRSADVLTLDIPDGDWDLAVETPDGTFTAGSPITVSGGAGYEFDWADLTGATGQRHLLSITATPA